MQTFLNKGAILLLLGCLSNGNLVAQSHLNVASRDSLIRLKAVDLIHCVRDSIEVELLKTAQTYSHVEQVLKTISPLSAHLDLLPCVLPVDVPLEAFRISSPFGIRKHPIHKQVKLHGGVDVKVAVGVPVKATAAGHVISTGYDPYLGAFVRVEHAFGFETTYGHLNGYCVKPGESVILNQVIGQVGRTGLATGPHLHYVIKKNGSVIDPFQFCFLLRRRLSLYQSKSPAASGTSDSCSEVTLGW